MAARSTMSQVEINCKKTGKKTEHNYDVPHFCLRLLVSITTTFYLFIYFHKYEVKLEILQSLGELYDGLAFYALHWSYAPSL